MQHIELVLTTVPLIIWLYLLFFYAQKKTRFNNYFWTNKVIFENQKFKLSTLKNKHSICIIIPARNEEKYIADTIKSLLSQKINKFILIVNDNSIDATTEEALKAFKKEKFAKFKILNGKKLPNEWSGKVWALKQGVDWAIKKKFSHFLFIDSDIILKKNIVLKTLNFMNERKLSMLSLMAKLKCTTIWECFLIPPFIYFFQKLYPFSIVNIPKEKLAAAAGGFILCRSELFRKKNLFNLIKNKIIDDCNIAKIIKSNGNAIWLGLTRMVESKRSYSELREIWKMVSRTAFEQLNHSIILLLISIFGMIVIYLLPLINLFFQSNSYLIVMNLLSIFLMNMSFLPTAKFYNIRWIFFILLPFSSFVYMLMTISSAYNYYFKSGNVWKGRNYQ